MEALQQRRDGRGEIGYRMLKEEGYSVKFLNAECECSTSGEYEIW